jgi:hypothetical protein
MTLVDYLQAVNLTYRRGAPHSLISDLMTRSRGPSVVSPADKEAAQERLSRAAPPGSTLSADVVGLLPGWSPPSWVLRLAEQRAASARRLIAALQSAELTRGRGRPFVPHPQPLDAAEVQPGEKEQLSVRVVKVPGESVEPTTIGVSADLSWLAQQSAGDECLALLGAATWQAVGDWLVDQLVDAAGEADDLGAAIEAVEGSWEADLLLATKAQWLVLSANPAAERIAGLSWLPVRGLQHPLLVASLGVWLASTPLLQWTSTEPKIGGVQMGSFASAAVSIGADSVAAITG